MRSRNLLLLIIPAIGIISVWMVLHFGKTEKQGGRPAAPAATSKADGAAQEALNETQTNSTLALREAVETGWKAMTVDASDAVRQMEALGRLFRSESRDEVARVIRKFLDERKDVPTRLPFAVGTGGNLDTAPTFRVWLLDQLGRIHPEASSAYAVEILATPNSAEEWAVAMRDFARVKSSEGDRSYLNSKMRELLDDPRWQSEQSAGWLEAFDVAVHTRATELTPNLARLLTRTEKQDKPASYAAFLTLDRLVQSAPVEMLSRFQAEPDLMKGRELTRANYFSRADVSEPRQREIVERYLLDAGRAPEELSKFAGLYPNANLMISKNLLTPTITPSREELVQHDREALKVVGEWLIDPRFSAIKPHIEAIHSRLSEFVRQAGK